MKRQILQRWVGACLLGSTLAAGCSQPQRRPPVYRPMMPPVAMRNAAAMPPPAITTHTTMLPPVAEVMPPEPVQIAKPEMPVEPPVPPTPPPAPVQTATYKSEDFSPSGVLSHKESSPRKSYVDITAHPCFGHAPDYTWVRGQVMYSKLKGWRLRYSSVDETDTYGGSVTLINDGNLTGLVDGQYVKVYGQITEPDGKTPAPPYRVQTIEPIQGTK